MKIINEREDENKHPVTEGKSSTSWLCLLQALNPTFKATLAKPTSR